MNQQTNKYTEWRGEKKHTEITNKIELAVIIFASKLDAIVYTLYVFYEHVLLLFISSHLIEAQNEK